jgi:ATP-dependent Lon protease
MAYGSFSGVKNYFVMAGKRGDDLDEKIGYYGEQLVLLAQTLGLNTCWAGLSYSKIPGTYELEDGEKIGCYIALGYGQNQGKEHEVKRIKRKELAPVGTTARIMRFEELPDGNAHGLFQGLKRFKLLAVRVENGKLMGDIEYLEEEPVPEQNQKPLFLAMQASMRTILKLNPTYSEELQSLVERADQKELAKLADFTVVLTSATAIELQLVLEELDVRERVKDVLAILKKEIIALKAKEDISREVDGRLSKQQHEFVLREQMRYIKEQLGIGHNNKSDEDYYQTRLEEIREFIPDEVADKVQDEIDKLNLLTPQSPEYTVSRNYLDWLTGLPWNNLTNDRLDVKIARRILNRDHYGLEDVKKRILEFIGVSKLKGEIDGSII